MILEVKNLSFAYGKGPLVLSDVNISLEGGHVLSILGANGAGKSTLLNCIAGIFTPKSGDVCIDGSSIYQMSRGQAARILGYVPQIHDSTFAFTVHEYVVMGRAPYIKPYQTPSHEDYEIARRNICKMGLGGMENKVFTEMSGGEQQLATIARVLTQEPSIILMDEPTNHLDYGNQFRALETMKNLAAEGFAVITTTHNPDHVFKLGGQVALLQTDGTLKAGNVEDVLSEESLSNIYGMPIGILDNADIGQTLCYAK